jgi:ABC-type uncharacterized transport system substrate-binding protein
MTRRTIGLIVIFTLAFLVAPLAAEAQPAGKVYRIGWLGAGSPLSSRAYVEAFQQSLRNLGYIEGQNMALEYRYAEGKMERLPELAAELVHLTMDVLVTAGSPVTQAAQHVTSTIPIVGVALADPLGTGFAASFGVLNTSNRKPPLRIPLRRAAEILTHPGQVEVVSPKRVDVLARERSDVAQRFVIDLMALGT